MNIIYIIQPRSSIEANLSVYKIGHTNRNIIKRLDEYEKGSKLIMAINVEHSQNTETDLLAYLRTKFINRKDFGSEYFEGPLNKLKNEVFVFCNNYVNITLNEDKVPENIIKLEEDKVPENIIKLEEHIKTGDYGFINIYTNNVKDIIICCDDVKMIFYLYNENDCLWYMKDHNDIKLHYLQNILKILHPLIEFYKQMEAKYKAIKNIKISGLYKNKYEKIYAYPQVSSVARVAQLVNLISKELYKKEFRTLLDQKENLVSFLNGIYDTKLNLFRKRCKIDYVSKVIDINYHESTNIEQFIGICTGSGGKKENVNIDNKYCIVKWLEENTVKTDSKKDILKLNELFNKFKCTKYYMSLTKQRKRELNYQYFIKQFSENIFFSKHYKERKGDNYNIIINYKLIEILDE